MKPVSDPADDIVQCRNRLRRKALEARQHLSVAQRQDLEQQLIGHLDKVVDEPIGGAHRDHRAMAATLKRALADALRELEALSPSELVEQRYQKLMSYGRYKEKAA